MPAGVPTPLDQAVSNPAESLGARLRPWLPAVFAIGLAFLLAASVWQARQTRLRADLMADFSFESRELVVRLQERMTAYRQVLRGARSTMLSVGGLSPAQWSDYVERLFLGSDLPGLRGLGFARLVTAGRLDEHESQMRAVGKPDYRVWPVDDRAAAQIAINRIAPTSAANDALYGRELGREPALRFAFERSAERAQTLMSAPLELAPSAGGSAAPHVFMVQPIYVAFERPTDEAEAAAVRRSATLGWVFGLFEAQKLIAETLGTLPPTMRLRVYAGDVGEAGPIEEAVPVLFDSSTMSTPDWRGAEPLRVRAPLVIDGQTWTLVFEGFPRAWANHTALGGELVAISLICMLFAVAMVLATKTRLAARRLQAMSAALQASNARFHHLATHDALTGVANRVRFRERLKARLADPRGVQARCAIIYIDLDHFKPVNDTLGHQAGDELLRAVTSRLGALLRGEDLLARRGGDEFVVLVDAVMSREDAEAIATRLCSVLAQPFSIAGQVVRISGSLGIALHPDDGIDDEALVARADRCMYLAKERGRNRWVSHDEASPAIA